MRTSWLHSSSRRRPRAPYANLINFIRKRLQEEPHDVRLRQSLTIHLKLAGRYREAIEEAERLIELAPGLAGAGRLLLALKLHHLLRREPR